MATSGTTAFDLSVDELIEEAYERCGIELRTGYDLQTARRSLNLMIAEWANRGLNQWLITQFYCYRRHKLRGFRHRCY